MAGELADVRIEVDHVVSGHSYEAMREVVQAIAGATPAPSRGGVVTGSGSLPEQAEP